MFFGLNKFLKIILPKRLFYRALIIVAAPTIILQLIITVVFYDSVWIKANKNITRSLVSQLKTIQDVYLNNKDNLDFFTDSYKNNFNFEIDINNNLFPTSSGEKKYRPIDRSLRRELKSAFGNNNYYLELQELGLIIDFLEKENLPIDFSKLAVIGHSRGGGITLLRTAQDARINKAITWASVSDFERRFPKDISDWKAKGVEYIYNGRTEQNMPLYFQLYTSFYEHKEILDTPKQCLVISQEVLVVHGTKDLAVGLNEAAEIKAAIANSTLEIIENANHTFGGIHPAKGTNLPNDLAKVVSLSIKFLR